MKADDRRNEAKRTIKKSEQGGIMKSKRIIALATAIILGMASFSYAGFVPGFKVVAVTKNQVTIQKDKGEQVQVPVKKGWFKVGDKVMFDAQKFKLRKIRKQLFGC